MTTPHAEQDPFPVAFYVAFAVTEGCSSFERGTDLVGGPYRSRALAEWWLPYYQGLLGAWVLSAADAGGQASLGIVELKPAEVREENVRRAKERRAPLAWPPPVIGAKDGDHRALREVGVKEPGFLAEEHVTAAVEEWHGMKRGAIGKDALMCFACAIGRNEVYVRRAKGGAGGLRVMEENKEWTGQDGEPLRFASYAEAARELARRWGAKRPSRRDESGGIRPSQKEKAPLTV